MHIAQFLFEYPKLSGPSEVVRGLSRGLIRAGCSVSLYGCGKANFLPTDSQSELKQARVILGSKNASNAFDAPRAIAESLGHESPDVLILHSMYSPVLVGMAKVARRLKIPYVVCPHNPYHPEILNKNKFRKRIYSVLFERPLLNAALGVYVLSEAHIKYLRDFGVKTPVISIPNGFDAASLPFFPDQSSKCTDPVRLLFLGRIEAHQKGLDLLLDAVARGIRDQRIPSSIQIRFAGPDGGSQTALIKLARRSGIATNIEFRGRVDHVQRWAEMAWADLLVLPSRFEGFPMVVIEAMVAGKPVLLSEETGTAQIVRDAGCGFLAVPHTDLIAAALASAIENRAKWPEMGQRGRDYCLRHLTWDQVAHRAQTEIAGLLADAQDRQGPHPTRCGLTQAQAESSHQCGSQRKRVKARF